MSNQELHDEYTDAIEEVGLEYADIQCDHDKIIDNDLEKAYKE